MFVLEIKSREDLVKEIACALDGYCEFSECYLNLTKQHTTIKSDPAYVGEDCDENDDGDEVVFIERIPSYESFKLMERFADQQIERNAEKLYRALNARHPFSHFRCAVEYTGLLQQWYDYKDKWYLAKAEEWMNDNGVDFVDGKIIADKSSIIKWIKDK